MSTIQINQAYPLVPTKQETYTGSPLRSLGSLADVTNHVAAYRMRRLSTCIWTYPSSYGFTQAPSTGAAKTCRMRMRLSPLATWLFIVFEYQAAPGVSGGSQIVVSVEDTAGVVEDSIEFKTADSTLLAQQRRLPGLFALPEYPFLRAHTPTTTRSGYGTSPRMLDASGLAGAECVVTFACTRARLRAASVWEWPSASVESP